MRPVDKGKAPEIEFKCYQDAEPYLEERIGEYCSFCEFPIQHVPEVEHREAKAGGGDRLNWANLLLSCKYCNTRKGRIVGAGDKEKYLWPDEDDTFHAFLYESDIPKMNEAYLASKGQKLKSKAVNLFGLIQLDHVPISPKDKDRRYSHRSEARNCALDNRAGWEKVKQSKEKDIYLKQIGQLAKATGFFSTWMEVFQNEPEVRDLLISVFKGTRKEFCSVGDERSE